MPTTRKLTPEEIEYLDNQGIDTSNIPDKVNVYSPEEYQAIQQDKASKAAGMFRGGVLPTVKAHAGELAGGGLGATGGAVALPALATLIAGSVLAPEITVPLTLAGMVGGGFVGSGAGRAVQKKIVEPALGMTPEQQEAEDQAAEIARRNYPKTAIATDVVGGMLAGGGSPSIRAPIYAAKGLAEGLANEGVSLRALQGSTSPIYKHAVQNVITGNALNTAINAGVQLTTTGTVDPTELGVAAVAGGLMSNPNPIGRYLNPEWKPIGKAQKITGGVEDSITPDGQSLADVEAYRKSAKKMTDDINAQNERYRKQRDAIAKLNDEAYNQQILEQQQKDKVAADWQKTNWLSKYEDGSSVIPDAAVKQEYVRSNKVNPKSESRPEQQAMIKQHNEGLGKVPIDQMRQELFERDYPVRDPQGYQQYKQEQAQQTQDAIQRAQAIQEAQRAQEQQAQMEQERIAQKQADFERAQEEVRQQQIQEAEAQRQEQQRQEELRGGAKTITENQAKIINTPSIAGKMMGEGLAQPREGRPLYQPVGEGGRPLTQSENARLLLEAAKANTVVGNIQGELRTPEGQLAKGISYDPNEMGKRLVGIAREHATTDTGYHELVHAMLRDLDRSPDPADRELAGSIRHVYSGEEPAAIAIGKRYRDTVEAQAKASLPEKIGKWFSDVYAATKAGYGSRDPEVLGQNLVRRMMQRHGEQDVTIARPGMAGKVGAQYQPAEGSEQVFGDPDNERLWDILRHKLYEGDLGKIASKEMLQNAHDAIMALPDPSKGQVHIDIDPDLKHISTSDNGVGMTPDIVKREFISPGRTTKEADPEALGKFGIAKVAYLGNAKDFYLSTVADAPDGNRYRTRLEGTGPDFLKSLNAKPEERGQGMTMTVEKVSTDTPTGTSLNIELADDVPFSSGTYDGTAHGFLNKAGMYSRVPYEMLFTKHGTEGVGTNKETDEYHPKQGFKASEPIKHPGATINVEHHETKYDTQYPNVHVNGKGLYQFSTQIPNPLGEAKFPAHTILDIHPNVDVKSREYPFNASREAVTEETKKLIQQRMTEIAIQHKKAVGNEYKKAYDSAKRMKGTHTYMFDVSQKLPDELTTALANDKDLAPIMKELKELHDGLRDVLASRRGGEYQNAVFGGMGVNGGFYGVNIIGDNLHTTLNGKHLILADPITTALYAEETIKNGFYKVYERGEAMADQLVATMHHELAHSYGDETWTEGEGLQKEMTRTSGMVANQQNITNRRIAKYINEHPEVYNKLLNYAHTIQSHGSESNVFEKISTSGDRPGHKLSEGVTPSDVEGGTTSGEGLQHGDTTPKLSEEVPNVSGTHGGSEANDLERYNELVDKMKQAVGNKDYEGFYNHQVETEAIKNRNPLQPGMPPTEESVRAQQGGGGKEEVGGGGDDMGPSVGSKYSTFSRFKPTEPALDKIKSDIPNDNGERVSDTLKKTFQERQNLLGRFWNPISEAAKQDLSNQQIERVRQVLLREVNDKNFYRNTLRTVAERNLYDTVRKSLSDNSDYRIAMNEPVYRDGKPTPHVKDPYYYPTTTDPKVADTFRQNTDQARIDQLSRDYIDQQMRHGFSRADAEANLKEQVDGFQGSVLHESGDNQTFYNAARKAQGVPLPDSWQRQDLLRNLEAYNRRMATDMAYYHNVETNHKVMAALGYKTDPWDNPVHEPTVKNIAGTSSVRAVTNQLKGESSDIASRTEHSAETFATVSMLGPLTEVHKSFSSLAQVVGGETPSTVVPVLTHAVTHIGEKWGDIVKTGYLQHDASKVSDLFNGQLAAYERLRGLSKAIRSVYSLGGFTEHFTKAFLQGAGEASIPLRAEAAANGDTQQQMFLKHLDPDYTVGKRYTGDALMRMASEYANQIHGTKDARTLPTWMLKDNEVSAFFKLSSWNIAQTNNFMRNVITPLKQGNFTPLLMTTLGTVLGGAVIKELREQLANKKSPIPSLDELAASSKGISGNMPLVAYNLMAMTSYAGLGGILSQGMKMGFDVFNKNTPAGFTFPADELLSNTATTARNMAEALTNDPNASFITVGTRGLFDLLKQNFQTGRVIMSHLASHNMMTDEENYKKQLSDKLGQLRRFKMAEGQPYEAQSAVEGNPYMFMEQKAFKREQDIGTAVKELPELVNHIITHYGSNPEVMMSKFRALKQNQYETFPSMEETPMAFMRYLRFLKNTKGADYATSEMMDYLRHQMINETKSEMVP